VLETFLGLNYFYVKDIREGVNSPMSCCNLFLVLVYHIPISNLPVTSGVLF
jgi:hypothetical protein